MNAKLILLRHGEIDANRVGRWHGSTDSPLTRRGRNQAKRTSIHLKKYEPELTAVYASPLQRCQATAQLATQRHDLTVHILDGLTEMSIGDWEDISFRDLEKEHQLVRSITNDATFTPPNGESLRVVSERVCAALHAINVNHAHHETVLVVSHGVALGVALATLIDHDPTKWVDYHFNNCSLTELRISPEPVVTSFNQYAHL